MYYLKESLYLLGYLAVVNEHINSSTSGVKRFYQIKWEVFETKKILSVDHLYNKLYLKIDFKKIY